MSPQLAAEDTLALRKRMDEVRSSESGVQEAMRVYLGQAGWALENENNGANTVELLLLLPGGALENENNRANSVELKLLLPGGWDGM